MIVTLSAGLVAAVVSSVLLNGRQPGHATASPMGVPVQAPSAVIVVETFDTDPFSRWTGIVANEAITAWHWRISGQNCASPSTGTTYPKQSTGKMWMGQYSATPPEYPNPYCNYGGVGNVGTGGQDPTPPFTRSLTFNNSVAVPGSANSVVLGFWSYEDTEKGDSAASCSDETSSSPCSQDIRRVYVKKLADTTWTKIWDTSVNAAIEKTWHKVLLNINQWRGQTIQIRFEFTDGADGYLNQFPGWYIDEIEISELARQIYLPTIFKMR
ncbi:MAG TPA: hypothetical protein VJ754_00260 [Anaerolineae bacterium]|nr:hypothetical protein [Anaerolineae bacterium]